MTRVLVIGASGQLGFDLMRVMTPLADIELTGTSRSGVDVLGKPTIIFDITDKTECAKTIKDLKPNYIFNTAAYHNLDECEANPQQAFLVNAIAVRWLAEVARDTSAKLIHFSTDYVFRGAKICGLDSIPYVETDMPNPVNTYGVSKLAGEQLLGAVFMEKHILRVSSLFGVNGCNAKGGKNFVENMIRAAMEGKHLRVASNQIMSPTYTLHAAKASVDIAFGDHAGVLSLRHLAGGGMCSWYEFALEIFRQAGITPDIEPVSMSMQDNPIRRPKCSALGSYAGPLIPDWKEGLSCYLREKGHIQ